MSELPLVGHWDPIRLQFLLAFPVSILFGAFARRTKFYPLGGVAVIMYGRDNGRPLLSGVSSCSGSTRSARPCATWSAV